MSPEEIIEIDAKRKGQDPGRIRYVINEYVRQGARTVRAGDTLFLFLGDGKGSVQFMWFTADMEKKFAQQVNEFMRLLKKAKAKRAYTKYFYAPANSWFKLVDPRLQPKVIRKDNYFQTEMRL